MPHAIYTIVHTQKKRNCKVPDKKNKRRKDEDKNSPLHNDVESQSFR